MVSRFALLVLFFSLIACGESTPSQTTAPAGSNNKARSWQGEFSLVVGELRLIPGQTKRSEVISALGQAHETERNDVLQANMRERIIWDCDVSLCETIRYFLDEMTLEISLNLFPDDSDGVVNSAKATGRGHATLGEGSTLGDSFLSAVERLMPHFESAADMPRLDKYQAWRPSVAPLVGDIAKDKDEDPQDSHGTTLHINNPYRNTIKRAQSYKDPTQTYLRLEPEWTIQTSNDTPDTISTIGVALSTQAPYWHKDRDTAEHVHWNRLRGRRGIAKQIQLVLNLDDDDNGE